MRRLLIALPVIAILAAPVAAASPPAAPDLSTVCTQDTNAAMTQCVTDHVATADKQLNDLWPKVLAKVAAADYLSAANRKAWHDHLVASERAWSTFKDEDCKGAMSFEWYGGSGSGAAMGTCLYDHTTQRITDLTSRYLTGQ